MMHDRDMFPGSPRWAAPLPGRKRAIELASSLRELLGDGAPAEALRRMIEATEAGDSERALLWFDAWTELEKPSPRR